MKMKTTVKRAADIIAGDAIGSFVAVRVEPFIDEGRTWYGVMRSVPMVQVEGLRLVFGQCVRDVVEFSADAMVTVEEPDE